MAQGIQVFNESGVLVFDGSTKITRLVYLLPSTGKVDGSVAIPNDSNNILVAVSAFFGAGAVSGVRPDVSVSGNTLSWTYNGYDPTYRGDFPILVLGY